MTEKERLILRIAEELMTARPETRKRWKAETVRKMPYMERFCRTALKITE